MPVPSSDQRSPAVSVVMSVYNGARYLREALDSVLAQTFTDFEAVCIDDGSTDETPAILAEAAERDGRVRVISQENQGLIAALNRGCREARAPLIARMDDDDVCHPERFERQLAFLDAHPEVGVLGTVAAYIDAGGELTGGRWPRWSPAGANGWKTLFRTNVCHPTVVMRRAVLETLSDDAGPYRAGALHGEDYELWTRALFATRIANLPEALLTRRKHDGTIGAQHAERQEQTVVEAMQQAHARLLGREIRLGTVALVRHLVLRNAAPEAPPERLEAAAVLIRDLYDAYTAQFTLDADEAAWVRRDAARKLLRLAQRVRPRSAGTYLTVMNLLMRVEPRAMLREVGARLRRKVART